MKVIEGGFGKQATANPELSAKLRELAECVDRGEIENVVAAYTVNGEPLLTIYGAPMESIALTAILQSKTLAQF